MTLQQQLLKAKWHKCKECNKLATVAMIDYPTDCVCSGTGIRPQIFENEIDVDKTYHAETYSKPSPVYKHKSGDVIEILCYACFETKIGEHKHKFKILRTLENGKKIEVVKQ